MNYFSLPRSDQLVAFFLALGLLILAGFKMASSDRGVQAIEEKPQKININTASQRELERLPCIGPELAERIIDYRKTHGNFQSIEELVKVKGIGKKTLARLSNLITVKKGNEATD